MPKSALQVLVDEVVECTACPRLVAHRRKMAEVKRRAYLDWDYWGKPVPPFGDPRAQMLVIGLAPAAHGGDGSESGGFWSERFQPAPMTRSQRVSPMITPASPAVVR